VDFHLRAKGGREKGCVIEAPRRSSSSAAWSVQEGEKNDIAEIEAASETNTYIWSIRVALSELAA
jgi:hypothetical protein